MALAILTLARDNKCGELRAAVASGIPVDRSNDFGQTALHIACLWGHKEAVQTLIELGADVNVRNSRGSTPLHFAANAKSNAKEVCQMLLDQDADTEAMDMRGVVPFEQAEDEEVRTMLGGPDARIFELAGKGDAAGLKALLDTGDIPSVRVQDSDGQTPIGLAITAESMETVEVLLDHDPACVNFPTEDGDTPLHVAAAVGNLDILRYILALKPELNVQNMNLSEYAQGNWSLQGEPIMPYDKSPLHVAVAEGDIETVKLLVEAGIDANLLDFDKASALHMALEDGDMEMIELLLEKGRSDVNQPHPDFVSPLHLSAQRGSLKLLQMLLAKGADTAVTNSDGWTPLHLAARAGNTDKVAALLAAGSNKDAVNTQGNTPLHLACINGHIVAAKALQAAGASLIVTNKEKKAPLDVCKTPEVKAALSS